MTEQEKNTIECQNCDGAPIDSKSVCECCARKKARTEKERAAIVNRLKRVEGQIRGIEKMVENDAYCTDIIVQVMASVAGLNAVNRELLSTHIRTCVTTDLRDGRTETAEELARLVEKLMK